MKIRPDPQIRAQNELLLKATFLHASDIDEDENWEGTPLEYEHRLHAAKFLLDMDTGPWSSDTIVHHCQVGCCANAAESRAKLWVAIQACHVYGKGCTVRWRYVSRIKGTI